MKITKALKVESKTATTVEAVQTAIAAWNGSAKPEVLPPLAVQKEQMARELCRLWFGAKAAAR